METGGCNFFGRLIKTVEALMALAGLVCIFLAGGNDGHNTIVPLAQSEFNAYKATRGSMALPDNNGALLPVQTSAL